jgi:hypothetical protein
MKKQYKQAQAERRETYIAMLSYELLKQIRTTAQDTLSRYQDSNFPLDVYDRMDLRDIVDMADALLSREYGNE